MPADWRQSGHGQLGSYADVLWMENNGYRCLTSLEQEAIKGAAEVRRRAYDEGFLAGEVSMKERIKKAREFEAA